MLDSFHIHPTRNLLENPIASLFKIYLEFDHFPPTYHCYSYGLNDYPLPLAWITVMAASVLRPAFVLVFLQHVLHKSQNENVKM